MIDDLSKTIRAVLHDPAFATVFPELNGAEIVFDRPLDPFTPAHTTVDVFLYDVRENLELRLNEVTTTRVGNQVVTHPAALRLACSYLLTAWPVGGTDLAFQEQKLLMQALRVLSHYPIIPASFLQGTLMGQDPPLPMVTLHPDALKNLAEFWSSLGSKLKPSLTVTVTISVPVFSDITDFVVSTHTTSYAPGTGVPPESLIHFGGRVIDNHSNGLEGALIDILDLGMRETTDADGQFNFTTVGAGSYNVRATATGFQPATKAVTVPGLPDDYVIQLAPL
jgi:Pvc16 N-terminal domain/Carboxypeptidase regulatory-like domain